jgi:hypothetical protein
MSIAAREWRAEWWAEGRAEGQKEALLHLLERRFGSPSEGIRARVAAGSTGEVEAWFDRAIDAESLGAVFGPVH